MRRLNFKSTHYPNVHDLDSALSAYWEAKTPREAEAAYHEVLFYGGCDAYAAGWRPRVARWLRKLALVVEGKP